MFPSFVSRRACPLKTLHEANKILPGAESAGDREFMCSYSALRSNGNTLALCQSHHAKQLEQGSTSVLLSDTSFPFKPIVALCFFCVPPAFYAPPRLSVCVRVMHEMAARQGTTQFHIDFGSIIYFFNPPSWRRVADLLDLESAYVAFGGTAFVFVLVWRPCLVLHVFTP